MKRAIELIHEVKRRTAGSWESVLPQCGVTVPPKGRHGPCAICGGSDRFHFIDDHGGGEWHCRQCDEPNHGDGLDLIARAHGITITAAAQKVASVLGVDARTPEPKPAREKPQTDIAGKVAGMAAKAASGQSAYLTSKGLQCPFPLMPDGSLLMVLKNGAGAVTGAQAIKPDGNKRLVAGTVKKGSFCVVNSVESPETVVIAEGLATMLSVNMMRPDALAVVAVDAGNLLPVAEVMRRRYPEARIIIAADNDIKPGEPNTGKEAADKAAKAVSGWVALPQSEEKADWNDFHQQNGLEAAAVAFNDSTYQPQGESVTVQLKAIEGGKKSRTKENGDISQMAASQKARLLSARWERLAVNTDSQAVYRYACGVWERLPEAELEREMVAIFDEHEAHYTEKGVKSVVATMKLQIPPTGEQPADCIGFSNGIYDLKAQEFRPHAPDNWLMNHNGIEYTPAERGETLATHAPNFTRWINHATGGNGDRAARIKAALFMVLARRHDWQLFIEVTGEGGSGKSVFSSIAVSLAGEHNTASASMGTLDTARGRAQLVGKSLIIMPDQTRYVGEGAGIKAITGGDPVEIDGKYEKQFTTVLNAVVLATNNEPMTFTERNGGIARRRVIFPFDNPVSEAEKDPDLTAKIRREMPVIIRHLLAMFADQNKAKTLLIEQRDSAEALGVKRGTDPVIDMCAALYFMNEPRGLMMGGGTWAGQPEPRVYLYHLYLAFMEYHGLGKPLSVNKFSRAIKSAAREYRASYLTRSINGRAQTNVGINELAEEFIPRAYGSSTAEGGEE
ncbi:DNA primase [Klebsiella pneumoniae]|uniref:phage/plasmid primase, P4 family n=1 Tax=Klebsiella pneumoniae TaxID=573 RepID=UPI000C7B473B|nr:phage/plasmid primase, P4 family [Klebsiella pneumoniae]MBF8420895.1 toprim domain-containing protein [Klebsiella pneumoniae]PLE80032.1 DNA primase [Klebsiella pneumoniae]HBQ7825287.1 toprim domain-containing protein [Klebsiella pneumoniae]